VNPEPGQQVVDRGRKRPPEHKRRKQQRKGNAPALEAAPEPRDCKRVYHPTTQGRHPPACKPPARPAISTTVTLEEKQQQMIDDFAIIEDAQERLAAVVDRARRRPPLPEADRTEANRVKGCISLAWIAAEQRDGRCHFHSDADSPLVRGLLALLCDFYSGATPTEVAQTEPVLLEELGLAKNLSPTRLNGLRSVRAKIRDFAATEKSQ